MRHTDGLMANHLWDHPTNVFRAAWRRWPNPIEATVGMRAPFNNLPRLPFQLGDCLVRLCWFVARLPARLVASRLADRGGDNHDIPAKLPLESSTYHGHF
jgi:hypothetical protein